MTVKQYAMVSKETNIVESSCMWDGNLETWTPPSEYVLLPLDSVQLLAWYANQDNTDWVLEPMENAPAGAEIGFVYNGTTTLTTPEAKPVNPPQPIVSGGIETL